MKGADPNDIGNFGDHLKEISLECKGMIDGARNFIDPDRRVSFEATTIEKIIANLMAAKKETPKGRIIHTISS